MSNFEYIFQVEKMFLYDILDEKKRVKNDSKTLGLSHWKDRVGINWDKKAAGRTSFVGKSSSSALEMLNLRCLSGNQVKIWNRLLDVWVWRKMWAGNNNLEIVDIERNHYLSGTMLNARNAQWIRWTQDVVQSFPNYVLWAWLWIG